MKNNVFVVEVPPEDAPGKYALLLTRGVGPFGGSNAIFYVDQVRTQYLSGVDPVVMEGIQNGSVIVAFPVGSMFVMVPRSQVRSMTKIEAETEERAEAAEMEKAFPPKDEAGKMVSYDPAGQYL